MSRSIRSLAPVHPRGRAVAALALTLGVLTACSGGTDAAGTAGADAPASTSTAAPTSEAAPSEAREVVTLTATEDDYTISLDQDTLTAGTYEIEVVNDGRASHDLVVERDGEDVAASEPLAPGESGTVEVTLEPGEYVFYCSISNHRSMGMKIPVTVS
ncbi:cupredoxin domain-containing protein [Blastococcus deserti]|uniref:Cupredoxin domain-containing protein n=1 Tax=Blastococcus deserti TaxID=2259033 RepID=A0ABW4XG13_9ACTN